MPNTTATFLQTIQGLTDRLNACGSGLRADEYTYATVGAMSGTQREVLTKQLHENMLACHHLRTAYLDASAMLGTLILSDPNAPIEDLKDQLLDDLTTIDEQFVSITMLLNLITRVNRELVVND